MDRVLLGAALEMKTRCIEMTPFYHCKKAELPDTKGGAPIRATVGNAPTGGLLLTLPRDVELPLRTPIEVTFYDPLLGVVRCRCSLFAPIPAGEMRSYRCEVLEQLSQTQRREDLKISLSAKVEVSYNGGHWPATIYNISASGVLLVSDLVAKSGEQLTFDFPKISPPISLVAEVLRVELRPARYGRVTYGYGCRFLNLTPQQESQLRSYIFQEERRLYHPD